jgi:RND family efflux transporter MFP subunit
MRPSFSQLWMVPALVVSSGLVACHRHSEPPSPTPLIAAPVKVQSVKQRTELGREEVVGTVRAKTRATLEAKLAGCIAELQVIPGQAVQKGERLALLDAQEWHARLEQAAAAHEQVSRDLDRYRELLKRQAVTQAEYDAMAARFRITEAGVQEARTMLGYTEIKAPFAGMIARKWADAGDLATPGRPLIELEDPATLQLEANVPESLMPYLTLGQTCAGGHPSGFPGRKARRDPSGR